MVTKPTDKSAGNSVLSDEANWFVDLIDGTTVASANLGWTTTSTTSWGLKVYSNSVHTGTTTSSLAVIQQDNASASGNLLYVVGDGTGRGIVVDQNGNSVGIEIDSEATGSNALFITKTNTCTAGAIYARTDDSAEYLSLLDDRASSVGTFVFSRNLAAASTAGPVFFVKQDHASDDQNALSVQNDGTGYGLFIDQNGNGHAVYIDTASTTKAAILMYNTAHGAVTNYAQLVTADAGANPSNTFYRNLAAADTTGPVVLINQDHASDDQPALSVQQDGTGNGMRIDNDGALASASSALFVTADGANTAGSSQAAFDFRQTSASSTKTTMYVLNAGSDHGLRIDQTGALSGSRQALSVLSSGATTAANHVFFYANNASTTTSVLSLRQDGITANTDIQEWVAAGTQKAHLDIEGDFQMDGTISKGAGTFTIDHPLDPYNKLLQHSFVESPEMMNVYKLNSDDDTEREGGWKYVVTKTGKVGEYKTTFALPDWFIPLNGDELKDYSFIVTALDGYLEDFYVDRTQLLDQNKVVVVSKQSANLTLVIYAVRHDAYAINNRVQVEVLKEPANLSLVEKEVVEKDDTKGIEYTFKTFQLPVVSSRRKGGLVHDCCDTTGKSGKIVMPDVPERVLVKETIVKKEEIKEAGNEGKTEVTV